MTTTACPTPAEVRAYLLGELPPALLDTVAAHLEECSACDTLAAKLDGESADGVVAALRSTAGGVTGPADPSGPPAAVGDYQILREVGRGGMGVVYQARHVGLNRLAAVKMILSGRYAGAEEQIRFRIEGEVLARLRHPNVVEVYETGQHDGRPYLVLEWVDGGTLGDLLDGPPLATARAALLAERLADAVHHAHLNGVVHRDLKPANVLITATGTPKVTDFGLARPMAADDGLTPTGTVLGTPGYMAPEQARGEKVVGPAADVYSLGAVLFALLTGRPPFVGPSPLEVVQAVVTEPPPAVSRFRRGVPRDLDTIARRCLEKEPGRRYPSACELADDLRRWRTGWPLQARPVPFWERGYRFARRNPVPAAAAALVVATAAGAFVRVDQARGREAAARQEAEQNERAATAAATAEAAARRLAERREALAAADSAVLRCEADDLALGLTEFARAAELADQSGDADLRRAVRANLAVWSARVPKRVRGYDPPDPGYSIRTMAFIDGGRTLVTAGGQGGAVKLWPTAGGPPRELPRPTWSFGSIGDIGSIRSPYAMAVFPDPAGTTLYVAHGNNLVRRWNPATLQPAAPDLEFDWFTSIQDAALSPDGRLLAAGDEDGNVRVWDTATGRPTGTDLVHAPPGQKPSGRKSVTSVAFAGPGTLLTAGRRHGVIIWDVPTRTQAGRLDIDEDVFRLAVDQDRQVALVGAEGTVSLWSLRSPVRCLRVWPHQDRVEAVAFSPDGRLAAAGDHAGSVRVWELATGGLFTRFRHPDQVRGVAFTPDGRGLVVGGLDGASALWELPLTVATFQTEVKTLRVAPVVGFTPDGLHAWTVSANGLSLWEPRAGGAARLFPPLRPGANRPTTWSGAVSPDGRLALTGSWSSDGTRLWDMATDQPVGPPLKHAWPVGDVGFLPDGRTFFTHNPDRLAGFVRWWRVSSDVDSTEELPAWPRLPGVNCLAPHPDGRRVLVGRRAGGPSELRLVETGAEVGPPLPHPTGVTAAAVHPAGKLAVTGGLDGGVRVWDLDAAELTRRVGFHTDRVNRVAWGPNDTLATASDDGTARLWDAHTLLPLGPPLRHATAVLAVAFDPTGRRLVTVTRSGVVTVWNADGVAN